MFSKIILAICAFAAVNSASADVVYKLQETFQSGAKFDGQVTLSDDLTDVTAVNGQLTGGAVGNTSINWIWFDRTADHKSLALGNNIYYDFLMSGVSPSYTHFMSFTWQVVNSSSVVLSTANSGNTIEYSDVAIDGSITPANAVPEPASLALLGLGLAGMAARRRKK